jgi:hypothetical protein
MKASGDIVGFVEHICDCDSSEGYCMCCPQARVDNYYCFTDECLKEKHTGKFLVDGVEMTHKEVLIRPPGNRFTVRLVGSDIPDGTTASFLHDKLHITDDRIQLTVQNGVSNEVTLTAPAQGLQGVFEIVSNRVKRITVYVKGFA